MSSAKSVDALQLERLVFFSDAVFAIAITLLVIDLRVPQIARQVPEREVLGVLAGTLSKVLGFVISFLVIGAYWVAHSRLYRYITRLDDGLMWRNLVFLMTVAFLPFPTAFYSEYGNRETAVIFYATSVALVGLMLTWLWRHAAGHHRLLDPTVPAALVKYLTIRTLTTPMVCVLVVVISLLRPAGAGLGFLLIMPLNRWVDRRHRKAIG